MSIAVAKRIEQSTDVLSRLVESLPMAAPRHVSYECEQIREARVLFDLLLHAYTGADERVDPVWAQEVIDVAYTRVARASEEPKGNEIDTQIHRVRGLFEISYSRLRDIAQKPWDHELMRSWLQVMKFELDTAADDFE